MDEAAIAAATIACKGDEWGGMPLWTLTEKVPEGEAPAWSVDVHALDEEHARAQALETIKPALAPVDPLVAALEKLPPDQPVTASELLAIIRGA